MAETKVTGAELKLDYSTTEFNTGSKWIDGKAIYKKTIVLGAYPNNTTKNVAHGITDLESLIKIEGTSYGSSIWYDTIGQYYDTARARIYLSGANIVMQTTFNATALSTTVTLFYTKL